MFYLIFVNFQGGDSASKTRRDPITTIYEHYKDTPTSSSQFPTKNPSIKKKLFDDNEPKSNVNNTVKSKPTTTHTEDNNNEYVRNITPLSPHTYKPVSPSNWRTSPLINNTNTNQINSQHTGNTYEQHHHQTNQNFNGN